MSPRCTVSRAFYVAGGAPEWDQALSPSWPALPSPSFLQFPGTFALKAAQSEPPSCGLAVGLDELMQTSGLRASEREQELDGRSRRRARGHWIHPLQQPPGQWREMARHPERLLRRCVAR